ncbi:flagellar biosynthesis protein FlgF [Methylobacterium sp. Leaf469]|uniref:flagellar basal-body rod protein FlgF n=1 Tax=unclassified Methylobacterium TaxID=2615210 RepID=UPI0006F70855|nr:MULTISPECIES: flagellar basal-body rod protein FlgF [unclassified Methylobacterium]USU32832.1 flagellar basal-body rod protein FlgF [Methylobacterium sp. OTU13CASTA1]KQO69071.1 flagellar biosynthesis protein FlgF [Methylobacterium sp. Leaf87]KQP30704.1 flagellar biosynthesis protein FlgF [Methylobacterium sp. Leaf102]KQP31426.1 flagellar biosynthesis protein FlgF [Methylobacterium sp. Leaf100]KQP67622.1 flagellar biosynthesis protein FlgF [Methylobacterium sp. Leaf112]
MQNAMFVGVSSQVALQRELEVIANNMANVSTNGFKARNSRFQEYLMPVASADSFPKPDRRVSYVIDQGTALDLGQGPIEQTGNPLHVAVRGEAFLVVRTPAGDRFTRNGAFETDPQGNLVTSDGYPVQGDGGPIQIGPQETGLAIGPDGTVSTNLGIRGRVRLVTFANPQALTNEGANLYASTAAPTAAGLAGRVESGALERSNVKPVIEMTRLMDVNRTYSMVSGVISRLDELRGTAIRRLAEVA